MSATAGLAFRGDLLPAARLNTAFDPHRRDDAVPNQEVLGFLPQIEQSVPRDCAGHWIVDHSCRHRTAKVRTWLAQRPHFHVHARPADPCWLHQVEGWFGFITQRVICRPCWQISEPTA